MLMEDKAMILDQVFSPESVILNLESSDKEELFEELLESIVAVQPEIDRAQALSALRERESKMSTGIMHGIAVPHGHCPCVKNVVGAIGISRKGIDYDALDKAPVSLVFMVLSAPEETERHLKVLKALASILQNPMFAKQIVEMQNARQVYDLVCQYEASLA